MSPERRIKKLSDLFFEVMDEIPQAAFNIEVCGISSDSRGVAPGMLFVAIRGEMSDGHEYIPDAVKRGCVAVVAESFPEKEPGVPVFVLNNTRVVIGYLAAAFYDFPTREMVMIGITGTNGKTTSSYILEKIIQSAGGIPAVVGTINIRYLDVLEESRLTTPEAMELQKHFRTMADKGVTHVIMEVSSHGLEQARVSSVLFDVALFTNLSRDHLDFHGSMERYFSAKKRLFADHLKQSGIAVVVLNRGVSGEETDWGRKLAHFIKEQVHTSVVTCGIDQGDVQAIDCSFKVSGTSCEIKTSDSIFQLQIPLVGDFNLENALGCICCGTALGYSTSLISNAFASLESIPGRLEKITAKSKTGVNTRPRKN